MLLGSIDRILYKLQKPFVKDRCVEEDRGKALCTAALHGHEASVALLTLHCSEQARGSAQVLIALMPISLRGLELEASLQIPTIKKWAFNVGVSVGTIALTVSLALWTAALYRLSALIINEPGFRVFRRAP